MKRILIIFMVMIMIIGIFACGESEREDEGEKTTEAEVIEEENKTEKQEGKKDDILVGTYNVPLEKIYVDTPKMNMIEAGYSRLFMENDVKYVAFTCLYEEAGTTAKDALDATFRRLKDSLHGYHQVNLFNEVEERDITVNGIDTYCIKGTVNCGTENKYDAYIYGYSFVYQGFPCSILGVVEDRAQAQEDIDEITEIVDAMMKTVRSEQ